jgi:hypothetical protein
MKTKESCFLSVAMEFTFYVTFHIRGDNALYLGIFHVVKGNILHLFMGRQTETGRTGLTRS